MLDTLADLGRGFFTEVRRVVSYVMITGLTLGALLLRPREGAAVVWRNSARQVVFTGFEAVWLVAFLAGLGAVVVVTAASTYFGGAEENRMVVDVFTRLLVREVAPFATAVLVTLRSGAAITVELGYMSARGEIEGIETAGIDPVRLLLVPRFVGVVTATVGLTIVFATTAFSASFATAVLSGALPGQTAVALSYLAAVQPSDVVWALSKAGLFGLTISAVACYHGLSVRGDVTEMPRRAARALVEVLIHCTIFNAALALIAL